jgi:prolipoprotein diacylglyceryltransferase
MVMASFLDFEWFRLFYLLAIGFGAILVIRSAGKDGVPMSSALQLFLWAAVFGILGSRLAELSPEGWREFLQTGRAADVGKTALGGIVGAILGLAIGRRVMGIQTSIWGWFLAWPAVLIVFRIGCLLAGCCAGTPTDLPWALTYPAGTHACELQHAHGLWLGDGAWSMPVHPVPVYEILMGLLLLLAVRMFILRGWHRQQVFFLSMVAYATFRFFEEFIRPENATDAVLNPVQIGLLAALPILFWFAFRKISTNQVPKAFPFARVLSVLLPLLVIFLCRNFWTTGEFLAFGMLLFAFGTAKVVALARTNSLRQIHWMVPGSLFAGALLMSQAAIDQTVPDGSRENSIDVGMGAAIGSYNETCGNTHTYGVAGLGAQYVHNINGRHQFETGVRGFLGEDNDLQDRVTIVGANPYFAYQNRWVGAELGVHAGSLLIDGQYRNIIPEGMLRVGPSDIFFAEFRVFNNGYTPVPGSAMRLGIGSGFGLDNGTVFRLGISSSGYFIHPSIVLQKNILIEPLVAYGGRDNYQFGLGLRLKLGLRGSKAAGL